MSEDAIALTSGRGSTAWTTHTELRDDVTNSREISAVHLGGEPMDREARRARIREGVR